MEKGKERGEPDNRVMTICRKRTYFQPAAAWRPKRLCRSSEQAAITWGHSDHAHISGCGRNQTLGSVSQASVH